MCIGTGSLKSATLFAVVSNQVYKPSHHRVRVFHLSHLFQACPETNRERHVKQVEWRMRISILKLHACMLRRSCIWVVVWVEFTELLHRQEGTHKSPFLSKLMTNKFSWSLRWHKSPSHGTLQRHPTLKILFQRFWDLLPHLEWKAIPSGQYSVLHLVPTMSESEQLELLNCNLRDLESSADSHKAEPQSLEIHFKKIISPMFQSLRGPWYLRGISSNPPTPDAGNCVYSKCYILHNLWIPLVTSSGNTSWKQVSGFLKNLILDS